MGKLIITDSNGNTSEVSLDKERTTIGRHANNDIVLNDKAVSGKHAAIVTLLEDSFLEDLKSTNGTQVNGEPITKYPLAHGDVISMGRNSLKYLGQEDRPDANANADKTLVLRPEQKQPAADFEKTMVLRQSQAGAPASPAAAGTPGGALTESERAVTSTGTFGVVGKPLLAKLRVNSGANQGKEMELTKALTTIGQPGVQVAAITRRADGYYIVHVGSGGGGRRPIVNGLEIDTQARKLVDKDRIELAGTSMEFVLLPG
ncbi:MAG: FHA domain-containing protein [Panacagrimonas sp.]